MAIINGMVGAKIFPSFPLYLMNVKEKGVSFSKEKASCCCSFFAKTVLFLFSILIFSSMFLNLGVNTALADWPLKDSKIISLGYLDEYVSSAGKTCTHHGIDIKSTTDASVIAPANGVVSFVGSIPADEVSGSGSTTGVSIKMEDDRIVTLLPFKSASVKTGDLVNTGDFLGTLAEHGDKSSDLTHLHIGLKRNSTYYDPSELLGIESSLQSSEDSETENSTVTNLALNNAASAAEETNTTETVSSAETLAEGVDQQSSLEEKTKESYGTNVEERSSEEEVLKPISTGLSSEELESFLEKSNASASESMNVFSSIKDAFLAFLQRLLHSAQSFLAELKLKTALGACLLTFGIIAGCMFSIKFSGIKRKSGSKITERSTKEKLFGRFTGIFVRFIRLLTD